MGAICRQSPDGADGHRQPDAGSTPVASTFDLLQSYTPTPLQRRIMDAMRSGQRLPVGGRACGRTTAVKLLICEEAATREDAEECLAELDRVGVVAMVGGKLAQPSSPVLTIIYDERE
jgi:hypothetical protein